MSRIVFCEVWKATQQHLRWANHTITINKALNQKPKTIKFEILSRCVCTALASTWFSVSFEKSELETDTHTDRRTHKSTTIMPSAHVHRLPYAFGACTPRHNYIHSYKALHCIGQMSKTVLCAYMYMCLYQPFGIGGHQEIRVTMYRHIKRYMYTHINWLPYNAFNAHMWKKG